VILIEKMKIAIVGGSSLVALVAGQLDLSVGLASGETGSLERLTEKRYQQLITQMNYYNPQFDPRRYWGYGCNCFHLSDRPMTDGLGLAVVDKLDDTCKKYKECLKCAAMEHGDDCVGELVKYKFQVVGDQVQCKNKANTCERSLCECDNLLARTHVLAAESWNIQYHTFWGNWDYKQECFHPKSPGSRATQNKTCCNNEKRTSSFALYAPDRQECCSNGEVQSIGSC